VMQNFASYRRIATTSHCYVAGSTIFSGMKSIADTRSPPGSTAVNDLDGVLNQGITLLRIAAVVLVLYVKFKVLLWIHRRHDGGGRE
jgi:hypothetical protein